MVKGRGPQAGDRARVGGRSYPPALGANSKSTHSRWKPAFLALEPFEETKRLTGPGKKAGTLCREMSQLDWMEVGGASLCTCGGSSPLPPPPHLPSWRPDLHLYHFSYLSLLKQTDKYLISLICSLRGTKISQAKFF